MTDLNTDVQTRYQWAMLKEPNKLPFSFSPSGAEEVASDEQHSHTFKVAGCMIS